MEKVVKETPVTEELPEKEETVTEEEQVEESPTPEETEEKAPGSKTDSELLLKSLQEERDKRRELEDKLKELESSLPSDDFSDEDTEISKIRKEIESLKTERNLEKVVANHPELKGSLEEFNEFASKYPQDQLDNVAKLFLVEKGLMGKPVRKGLEKPTGGGKNVPASGITTEEIADLRKTNYKKYLELLKSGKIQPKDIK